MFKLLFLWLIAISVIDTDAISRIVGGYNAKEGQYPYQVSIRNRGKHDCGGAIIDQYWILTAAHCLIGRPISKITVVVGSIKLDEGGTTYNIEKMIPNSLFNLWSKHDDIGLIKVDKAIVFGPNVQPIKLPSFGLSDDINVTLTGWGNTELNGKIPNDLQVINITTISFFKCVLSYNILKIRPTNICTYTKVGEGICYGDSGGPLVYNDEIIGIVSWGTPCAEGKPDVFTRVDYYLLWIYATKLGLI